MVAHKCNCTFNVESTVELTCPKPHHFQVVGFICILMNINVKDSGGKHLEAKQPRQRMWGYPCGVAINVPVARPYL
ncbi:MAG: hypothetical protein ACJAXQ_001465 [Parvibaculaceae bacterium]|jgi:hypothetical protein